MAMGSISSSCPYNNFVNDKCLTPKETALLFQKVYYTDFDVEASRLLLAPDIIQHNPLLPTGANPIIQFISVFEAAGSTIDVHRCLEYGNLVACHATYTNAQFFGADTMVGFEVFRVEDGVLQERWDNLVEKSGPNPSGHTMVDGATEIVDLEKTEYNKKRVVEFFEEVLIPYKVERAGDFCRKTSSSTTQ